MSHKTLKFWSDVRRHAPLVGRSVYLDFKGMGRSVIQSIIRPLLQTP